MNSKVNPSNTPSNQAVTYAPIFILALLACAVFAFVYYDWQAASVENLKTAATESACVRDVIEKRLADDIPVSNGDLRSYRRVCSAIADAASPKNAELVRQQKGAIPQK